MVYLLIVLCVVPELVLQGADWGLWGSTRLRSLTYQNGAFWAGLLQGWRPNYTFQPYSMFVTYAFLHAGLGHLVVNMITLFTLGGSISASIGTYRFLFVYIAAIFGGALGFGWFGTTIQPMVGASGGLFGLAGAWIVLDVSATISERPGLKTLAFAILWPITLLILLNVVMYWSTGGQLAWETHLGGFFAGCLATFLLARTRTPDQSP